MKWFEEKAIDHIDEEEVKERYSCDNLFIFNESVKNVEDVKFPIEECCNFPFYKMFIDSNGDVLLCCSDWNRKEIVGNVMNTNIYSIWKNNFYKYRKDLLNKKRNSSICRECSMNGILAGNEFKNFWKEYYDKNNR